MNEINKINKMHTTEGIFVPLDLYHKLIDDLSPTMEYSDSRGSYIQCPMCLNTGKYDYESNKYLEIVCEADCSLRLLKELESKRHETRNC